MKSIEKKYKIFTIIGLVFIILVLAGGLIFGPFNSILPEGLRQKLGYGSDQEGEIEVRLIVDFSGFKEDINITILFEDNEIATAYSILLEANLSVRIKEYQNGFFVEGIEDIIYTSEYFWWYLADGQSGGVASNRFDLRINNVLIIEWQYKNSMEN